MADLVESNLIEGRMSGSSHLPADSDLGDGEFVRRFVANRDDSAFATLVERHGPLVLAVCSRLTQDRQLAEDAFQAVFLVLARKAADIRPPGAVRPWLYGVAVRSASQARSIAGRRRVRETLVSDPPERIEPMTSSVESDALRALEEEIAALPDHLRSAVVLCELEGVDRAEAARRLRIPEGTLSSRLAKARKVLARRLRRHDVVVGAAAMGAIALQAASASPVPAALAQSAFDLSGAGKISIAVSEIARGVLQAVLLQKLRMWLVCIGAVVFSVSAPAVLISQFAGPAGNVQADREAGPETAIRADPGRILFTRGLDPVTFHSVQPDGTKMQEIEVPRQAAYSVVPSRDARKIAYWEESESGSLAGICLFEPGAEREPIRISLPDPELRFLWICWSPDSRQLHLSGSRREGGGFVHYRLDSQTQALIPVAVPKTHLVTDWSSDGKLLLTTEVGDGDALDPHGLYLLNVDGTEFKTLATLRIRPLGAIMSSNGKQVLFTDNGRLSVLDASRVDAVTPVAGAPRDLFERYQFDWSPRGNQIVFVLGSDQGDGSESARIVIADPDGRNQRAIWSPDRLPADSPGTVFWR